MSFKLIVRGAPTRTIIADYLCDACGRFELELERTPAGDAPDDVECPSCGARAIWVISAPLCKVRLVEAVKGKHAKPERETWTNTDAVGEGQPLHEWHEERAKVWERWRQRDVMRFAKEHHERPIGHD